MGKGRRFKGNIPWQDHEQIGKFNGWVFVRLTNPIASGGFYNGRIAFKLYRDGEARNKANYWMTWKEPDGLLHEGKDLMLLATHHPDLHQWVVEYVEMWEAIKP